MKIKKIKESKRNYHEYIDGDYYYMIRLGDFADEIENKKAS